MLYHHSTLEKEQAKEIIKSPKFPDIHAHDKFMQTSVQNCMSVLCSLLHLHSYLYMQSSSSFFLFILFAVYPEEFLPTYHSIKDGGNVIKAQEVSQQTMK